MDINELDVHRAFLAQPELFENGLGVKIEPDSIKHHYLISDKGDHIDFLFQDVQGVFYIAEVKLWQKPISVIPQLLEHEYKKFVSMHPDIPEHRIVPVIVVDTETATDQDATILRRMGIRLCRYDLKEIESILAAVAKEEPPPPSLEFPDATEARRFLEVVGNLKESYGDISYLLEGFRGEGHWDGYYDFRLFWLWKDGRIPDTHKRVFKMLLEQRLEDCIWYAFITAAADSEDTAAVMFDRGYTWDKVLAASQNAEERHKFEECLCEQRFNIQALKGHKPRKQVFKDYIKMVGASQLDFFLGKFREVDNPFDAYDIVYKTLRGIRYVGDVVAGIFATYLSQWRILPIIPTENVRTSRYVQRALKDLGIKKDFEDDKSALLRLAKKYSVLPVVFERAMHKLGRRAGEKPDSDED